MSLIGEQCDNCNAIITADDDEATQYYEEDELYMGPPYFEEEPRRVYFPDMHVCCLECLHEAWDNTAAAIADNLERGLDYAY